MRTVKRQRQYYNKWDNYESDLENDGWQIPCLLVKHTKHFLFGGEKILDICCGTGLVGVELKKVGWHGHLVGVDVSERRIGEALEKDIYQACFQMDANKLGFFDERFDVVLSSAVVGLTGSRSVREMCRVLKVCGLVGCAAGEFRYAFGGSTRFRSSISCMDKLPDMARLDHIDLGSGYSGTRKDEHYILRILRRIVK